MSLQQQLVAWLTQMQNASYYAILRIPQNAPPETVKVAFHAIALRCHPDRYVDQPSETRETAGEVFKRVVEAYNVLSKPAMRAKYDVGLARGKLRFVEGQADTAPPPRVIRTLEDLATSVKAKAYARRADMLISVGKLDEARVALASATQEEPDNIELRDRLGAIYEALALEPER
jgi:curved DNA-binding protein CbpA